MYPYFVESSEPCVRLYQLKNGRFQMIEHGNICRFMQGYRYLLVEKELASFLKSIGVGRVAFRDAIIFNRKTNEEFNSHVEVIINQYFDSDQIQDIDLDGDRILMMDNQYVFVRPSLKEKLESSKFKYLRFSEGLSNFAG